MTNHICLNDVPTNQQSWWWAWTYRLCFLCFGRLSSDLYWLVNCWYDHASPCTVALDHLGLVVTVFNSVQELGSVAPPSGHCLLSCPPFPGLNLTPGVTQLAPANSSTTILPFFNRFLRFNLSPFWAAIPLSIQPFLAHWAPFRFVQHCFINEPLIPSLQTQFLHQCSSHPTKSPLLEAPACAPGSLRRAFLYGARRTHTEMR